MQLLQSVPTQRPDGGWLKAHPLPADKDSFGNFEALSQQNKQVIQKILEDSPKTAVAAYDYDGEILKKLGDQYTSCLDERNLNEIGDKPMRHIVKTIRRLYREEDTDTTLALLKNEQADWEMGRKFNGLTAAVAYLHSRRAFFDIFSSIPPNCTCRIARSV